MCLNTLELQQNIRKAISMAAHDACQRFGAHKHIRHPIVDIYQIHFFRLTWYAGYAYFLYELFVRFIYTNNTAERNKWALVNLQHILHF